MPVDADLRWRNPAAYEDLHRKIRHHVLNELVPRTAGHPGAQATVQAVRQSTASRRVLSRPITSPLTGESDAVVDQYRPQDKPDLLRMTAATEGDESSRIVSFWLDRQPSAFTVFSPSLYRSRGGVQQLVVPRRGRTGTYSALIQWSRRPGPTVKLTPTTAPNLRIAITRHLIDPNSYMRPSAVTDLCYLHTLRSQLDGSRSIHWEYKVFTNLNLWAPWMLYLNFTRLPVMPRIGRRNFALFSHDWQVEPIEEWQDRNITRELWGSDVPPNLLPDSPDAAPTSPRNTPTRCTPRVRRTEFGARETMSPGV